MLLNVLDIHPSLIVKFNKDFQTINNSEFVQGTALIAYPGDNRNSSNITENAFFDAIPSLGLVPIVGHWLSEKQNFGGHDITIEWSGNELILKDNTVPYGVVKENHNAEWIDVEEKGIIHKYLKADVVLWYGRYPEPIQKVIDDGINQSMEINVKSYCKKQNNNIQIDSFEFSALCLLGRDIDEYGKTGDDNVEPCFESASIIVDKFADNSKFKEQFNQLLFALNNKEESNISPEGGEIEKMSKDKEDQIVNEKLELIAKYNLSIEQLDFSIEELSIEELEGKLKEFSESGKQNEIEVNFSATYNQKREALRNALDPIIIRDEEDKIVEETYFWVSDFDDEFVYVEKDYWGKNDSEFSFGRVKYTFDETTITATVDMSSWEKMIRVWLTEAENQKIQDERNSFTIISTENEELKIKVSEFEATISTQENTIGEFEKTVEHLTSENTKLQEFKSSIEFENKKIEIENLIEDFESILKDNEEFQKIKEDITDDEKLITMEYHVLEEKFYTLVGKIKFESKKREKVKKPVAFSRVNVEIDNNDNEIKNEYGEASKYLPKK